MYCKKCGNAINAEMRFCKHCGEPLGERGESAAPGGEPESAAEKDLVPEEKASDESRAAAEVRNNENDGKKKKIIAGCIALVVIIACVAGVTAYLNNQKDAEYNAKIAEASQYLQELDYEKAETAYLDAIDIEPKRSEAYLELSNVYVAQQEFDAALDVLEEGKQKTGDEKTFDQKIEEVTKQSEADPKSAQYKAYYELVMEYQDKYGEVDVSNFPGDIYELMGLCLVKLFDFNRDGNEELILGYCDDDINVYGQQYQFEVWAWHGEKLVNALPAHTMDHGNGEALWISTAVKDNLIYMETGTYFTGDDDQGVYRKQYLQYEKGKFTSKYEFEYSQYSTPPWYSVNGTQVDSWEEAEQLMKDFPGSSVPDYGESKFVEEENGALLMAMVANRSYCDSIIEETERNIDLLRAAQNTDENSGMEVLRDLPDFYFSSGAGAWGTNLHINEDGTFTGDYHDSEAGGIGDGYPNGTRYICNFSGSFTDVKQIDEYTWSMQLENLEMENTPGEEWIEDGIKHIASGPYGIEGGKTFYLYLPGISVNSLPEEYRSWYMGSLENGSTLHSHGLYNVDVGLGFLS